MTDKELLMELDDVVSKLKQRIIYYQTEIKDLKKRIQELKIYVKEK